MSAFGVPPNYCKSSVAAATAAGAAVGGLLARLLAPSPH